jgi:hypothetical protein
VQILLGHTKIENTVRYLGVDIEDALALAEGTEIRLPMAAWPPSLCARCKTVGPNSQRIRRMLRSPIAAASGHFMTMRTSS